MVAGYCFLRLLFFSEISVPKTGLLSVILYVLRGGLQTKKSWLASLTCPFYLSALASKLATQPNKKSRTSCRTFMFVPFAGLSSNEITTALNYFINEQVG